MAIIKTSCEDPKTKYLCLFGIRFVFYEGKYVGWYKPGTSLVQAWYAKKKKKKKGCC